MYRISKESMLDRGMCTCNQEDEYYIQGNHFRFDLIDRFIDLFIGDRGCLTLPYHFRFEKSVYCWNSLYDLLGLAWCC